MSQEKPTKKLSRSVRYNKKRRLNKEQESTLPLPTSDIPPEIRLETPCIIFDPSRHRTQYATRGLCTRDKIQYIEKEWRSVPLCLSDRITSGVTKIREEISTKDLLIGTLIREAGLSNNIQLLDVPPNFLRLVNEIIKMGKDNAESISHNSGEKNKRLWVAFGRWLGMEEPVIRRDVRRHLRSKWIMLQPIDFQNKQRDVSNVTAQISRNEKARMIMSARGDLLALGKMIHFRNIVELGCITDAEGGTLIHLGVLDDGAVKKATEAVNHYYFHTLSNPSHRSNDFWENFIEHFGTYTRNNLLPFTSSNTASSHNVNHQGCVNTLFHDLYPLSISVNQFMLEYYGGVYKKLENLSWGAFGPRPFGVFPMIAINFNTISDYHWDEHDEPNSLCFLVALGDFEGGELCFPQLQIVISLKPGQVVAFSSRLLLHGNLPITRGIRHSVVYFVHSLFFHHQRDFSPVYNDLRDGIERDARGSIVPMIPRQDLNNTWNLNNQIRLDKPKANQVRIPPSSTDCRRGHIDLRRARRGLKAEDPLPDGV